MYHALLTNRYLTSRVIPLIAVAAVALCVALVIIVVSVMTGFLNMVRASGRTLMGDVVVSYAIAGIPHYERLIERIEQLPEAEAATPVVDSGGLLRMPYPPGDQKQINMVQIWGIDPEGFARVTGYRDTIWWRSHDENQRRLLLQDVIERHWREVRDSMTDSQRIDVLQRLLNQDRPLSGQSIDPTRIDAETVENMTDEGWERAFMALAFHPVILKDSLTAVQWQELLSKDARLLNDALIYDEPLTMKRGESPRTIVLGMHVSEANRRQKDGSYQALGGWWMPRFEVALTTVPLSGGGLNLEAAETRLLHVVNEFVSGVFIIDNNRVLIPLSIAQEMMHLNEAERLDPADPDRVLGIDPARATLVLVRAAPGVTPPQLQAAVRAAYDDFFDELRSEQSLVVPPWRDDISLTVKTWEEHQAQFIGPVEKEREMMRILFSVVYLVCAGLVLAIFWAIVYEKTRDIGILRSIGASREGVLWIFVRYGLITATVGSLLGLALAYFIVRNINHIQSLIAEPPLVFAALTFLPCVLAMALLYVRGGISSLIYLVVNLVGIAVVGAIVGACLWMLGVNLQLLASQHWEFLLALVVCLLLAMLFISVDMIRSKALVTTLGSTVIFMVFLALTGLVLGAHWLGGPVMWDPSVYYFTKIPSEIDWRAAWGTVLLAITVTALGAAVAAAKAADTDPVTALRYE